MKKTLYSLIVLFVFSGCEVEPSNEVVEDEVIVVVGPPSGTGGTNSEFDDIFGISNVVNYQGSLYTLVSYAPKNNFPGYPDASSFFYKISLLNIESGESIPIEPLATADQTRHSDLQVTPDNKLAMIYQKPTGDQYGFDLAYKEYAHGSIVKSAKVFQNANWGAWPRLDYNSYGNSCIISFSHYCYQLLYFEEGSGYWDAYQISDCHTYYSDMQFLMENDVIYLSALEDGYALIWEELDPFSWNIEYIDWGATANGSLAQTWWGDFSATYSKGNAVMYAERIFPDYWETEVIDEGNAIEHKIALAFDEDDTPWVAFQSNERVKVFNKVSNTWSLIFSAPISTENAPPSYVGRGPSLVKKGAQLFLVYADLKEVSVKRLL